MRLFDEQMCLFDERICLFDEEIAAAGIAFAPFQCKNVALALAKQG